MRPEGSINLAPGASLTIAAGTRVEMPVGSSIAVRRDARLRVDGTLLEPVVLTCAGVAAPGCWDGLVVAGNAPVNEGTLTSPPARGSGASGCAEITGDPRVGSWGGCDPADSSGVLRYARIENSVNGLELLGVGSRTIVDFIQVAGAQARGVLVGGGLVDLKHVVVTGSSGPSLAFERGWRGRGQFLHLETDVGATDAPGIRGRNAAAPDAAPRSMPRLANVTIIGRGSLLGAPSAIRLVDGAGLALNNTLIQGLIFGLDVDGASTCAQLGSSIDVTTMVIAGEAGDPDTDADCGQAGASIEANYLAQPQRSVISVGAAQAAQMLSGSFNSTLPDFRPVTGQIAASAPSVPSDGFFTAAPWYGASEPGGASGNRIPWHSGWTVALRPAARATMTSIAGSGQTGLAGFATNVRPAVRLTDATGASLAGVEVRFAATGGGTVGGATKVTSASGLAQVDSWTTSAAPGPNTLTAFVSGVDPMTFTATSEAPSYSISIQNVGPPIAPAILAAMDSARSKWERIIYRDLPDLVGVTIPAGQCGNASAVGPLNVDDLLVLAQFDSIDGPGQILGFGGPCAIRSAGGLTVYGQLTIDSADARALLLAGRLKDVLLHELGHVLGIGTLWPQPIFNCLQNPSAVGVPNDTFFSCAQGRAAFDSIGGLTYTGGNKVPVENCAGCGPGTINSHWRESVFVSELMTGFNNAGANPLSVMTAASLSDLGYVVNYAGSDAFQFMSPLAAAAAQIGRMSLGDDARRGTIIVLDSRGRVVPR